jgi:hypothetical protein
MIDKPRISGTKRAEIASREARLSRALRDNLRRRKEQARAREQPAANLADDGSLKGKASNGKPPA